MGILNWFKGYKRINPNLLSFKKDTVRAEKIPTPGGAWCLYQHDGERFQFVEQVETEEIAISHAKQLVKAT